MNIFDDMPDIPPCPKCGHDGEGLNFAYPGKYSKMVAMNGFDLVQAACLDCGFHAAPKPSYDEAIKAFVAGEAEPEAAA